MHVQENLIQFVEEGSGSDLWQARAEALLPILQAAANITHSPKFQIRAKDGAVLIPYQEYEALYQAVESFRLAAVQEAAKHG